MRKNAAGAWKCSYILEPSSAHELCSISAASHLHAPLIFISASRKRFSRAHEKNFAPFHPRRPIKAGKVPFKCIKHKLSPKLRTCRACDRQRRGLFTLEAVKTLQHCEGCFPVIGDTWPRSFSLSPPPTKFSAFPFQPDDRKSNFTFDLQVFVFDWFFSAFQWPPTSHRHATNTKPDLCQCYPLNIASQLHSAKKGR